MVSVLTVCSLFLITSPHTVVKGKYSVEIYLIIDLVKAGGRFCLFLEIFWVSDRQVDIWTYWHRWQVQTGSLNILNQQNHPSIQNQSDADNVHFVIRLKVRTMFRRPFFVSGMCLKMTEIFSLKGWHKYFLQKWQNYFLWRQVKIYCRDSKNCIYWSGRSEVVL